MNIARRTITSLTIAASLVMTGLGGANPAEALVTRGFMNEAAPLRAPILQINRAKAKAMLANVRGHFAHAKPRGVQPLVPVGTPHVFVHRASGANNLDNHGGPVVGSAKFFNLYVNGAPANFGFPGSFISDSSINGANQFFHVTDQYVGTNANNRYTYGGYIEPSYDTSSTLQDADIYNIVDSASNYYGTNGYGAVFNVFLQPGVAVCTNGGCYGTPPNNYCAWHGSVDLWSFNGLTFFLKHLVYTVEPYQEVAGCESPSGNLTDSTTSVFSHEAAETLTDPDGNAWWNSASGQEIGDLCRWSYSNLYVGSAGTFFNRTFNIQQEWLNDANNGAGGCGY